MTEASWDPTWEDIYTSREWGKYPPEELVRFIARNFYSSPDRAKVRILDLGCGTGAATWFMAREGFSVAGIDGSATAIEIAEKRFADEGLAGEFMVGDIIALPWEDASFDAVTDIASIQHNTPEHIETIIEEVKRVLKPGGKFFGMMIGRADDLTDWEGVIHYFKLEELHTLFREFSSLSIEHVRRTRNDRTSTLEFWLVEATR